MATEFHAARDALNRRARIAAEVSKLAQRAEDPGLAARLAVIAARELEALRVDRDALCEALREEMRQRFRHTFLLTIATQRALAECQHGPQFRRLWRRMRRRCTACARGINSRPSSVRNRRYRRRRSQATGAAANCADPEPAPKAHWDLRVEPSFFQRYPDVGRHPHVPTARLWIRTGAGMRDAGEVNPINWPEPEGSA